jgi:hypothetical protein
MGLFDRVYSEYPLPNIVDHEVGFVFGEDGFDKTTEFQTKSFDRVSDKYVISEDGRLTLYDKDIDFHGRIIFYTQVVFDDKIYTLDYHAKFTNGNLVSIWGEVSQCFSNI